MFSFAMAALLHGLPAAAQSNGIFADVSTSMGVFTVELDYVKAPRTAANFIGLATGEQAWRDPETVAIRTNRFYAGTAVHQIRYDDTAVPGTTNRLAIQSGLRWVRNGLGGGAWTGGPGYTILDEVTNGLSHLAGAISMVQSGPHTGASEFLVTCTNAAVYWDGQQTVFGQVVSNMAVVEAIAGVPMSNGIPTVEVGVTNIAIRRVGSAAEAFDLLAWELPQVTSSVVTLTMGTGGANSSIAYDVPPQSEYFVVHTPSLLNPVWGMDSVGFHSETNGMRITNSFSAAGFGSNYFFHAEQSHYPVFSAIPLGDGLIFAAEWSDTTIHQYQLDLRGAWGNATGIWVTVSNGMTVGSGNVTGLRWRTRTANSTQFEFFDNVGNTLDYTLGFDAFGARTGRYRVVASDVLWGTELGTDFGACEYEAWSPGGVKAPAGRSTVEATAEPIVRYWEPERSTLNSPQQSVQVPDGATKAPGSRPGR